MADRRRKATAKQASPTAYVVLQRVNLADGPELPVGVLDALGPDRADWFMWAPVLAEVVEEGPDGQPRIFMAANQSAAIRQHTGTGEDIKPGTWKAIALSSWKGGETTRTKVTAERLPFEEGV